MRGFSFVLAFLLVVSTHHLFAQQPAVQPGQRVRITHQCESGLRDGGTGCRVYEGTIASMTSDSLVLWSEERRAELAVPVASLDRYEVYWEGKSNTKRSALMGLAIGGGFGFLWNFGSCWIHGRTCAGIGDRVYSGLVNGALTAVVGAGIGALIGMRSRGRWEEIPLDRLRVSAVAREDGRFGLVLSVNF